MEQTPNAENVDAIFSDPNADFSPDAVIDASMQTIDAIAMSPAVEESIDDIAQGTAQQATKVVTAGSDMPALPAPGDHKIAA